MVDAHDCSDDGPQMPTVKSDRRSPYADQGAKRKSISEDMFFGKQGRDNFESAAFVVVTRCPKSMHTQTQMGHGI